MRWVYALVVLSLLAATPALADIDRGEAAFERGDYETAPGVFRPLAAEGDAQAQHNLGFMYYRGEGVEQDFAAALNWFRKAAAQGSAPAQARLGKMYYRGKGVAKDHAMAANH